jgi:hypothetical protein
LTLHSPPPADAPYSDPNHPNAVFERARDAFIDSLPPAAKASFTKCPSASALIADVGKLGLERKDRLWGKRLTGCIAALGNSLEPYFEAIGIFVQSHPEYAAIVWGGLRLMFKVFAAIPCINSASTDLFSSLTTTVRSSPS